ncbi:DNA polymerase epsilon subunit 2 [Sparganum proliferum]
MPTGFFHDIKRALKLNGLLLAPDASTYVVDSLKHLEPTIREKTIKKFVDAVLERNLEIDNISKTVCEDIFREWQSESTNSQEFLFINDAFQVPRFKYCKYSRKFLPLQDSANDMRSLLPNSPSMKAFLYAHRYEMVYQRVIRNPIFASSNDSNAGTNGSSAGFKLQPIEFLLALGAKEDSVVVLGALTQLKNGQWYLEDPTNLVKLDLSAATFHQGLFPEGAIVLAEGSFDDDVFKVTGIGLPPVEEPHLTRRYFSVPNPFGGSIVDGPAAAADTNMIRLLQTSQDLAVETIELLLREKYDETENRLGHAQIIQLLKFCLKTYFTLDGTIYEQVKGTPMGSPISGLTAEAVLQRLESLVFRHHRPKFWARYVDDTFVVIERDQVLTFKEQLNAIFPDIQFTMEEEENNQLAFLDVLVCRKDCGRLKTKVFRKATNTTQILNFNSNHPISHKRVA